jgi:DNA-binding NtrC family response regulator
MMPILAPAPSKLRKPVIKPTVLIAEGDELTLDAMQRYLLLRGYEIETATGGVECLEKLRRNTGGVLILDLELTWGGGDGVLSVMRDDPVLASMPVILTSIQSRAELWFETISPPITQILFKPFSLESLLATIRLALGG